MLHTVIHTELKASIIVEQKAMIFKTHFLDVGIFLMIDNTINDIILNLEHLEIYSNMKQNKYVSTCIEINNIVNVLVSI